MLAIEVYSIVIIKSECICLAPLPIATILVLLNDAGHQLSKECLWLAVRTGVAAVGRDLNQEVAAQGLGKGLTSLK